MGVSFSMFSPAQKKKQILMVGLNDAGKTTILYKIKHGEAVLALPTVGSFNFETIQYKDNSLTIWDIDGNEKTRAKWCHFYEQKQGLIFVVDSNDTYRIEEANEELQKLLAVEELRDASLLVFANKQDFSTAMSIEDLTNKLGLHFLTSRRWHIQASCAIRGEGISEGLDWLLLPH